MSTPDQPFPTRAATQDAFAAHVSRGKVNTYREYGFDAVMGAREGVRFYDAFGERSWFNCHCNGGVYNLGHRNPRVIAAVKHAMDSLDIGNHHLVSGHRAALARELADTTDGALPGVVFGACGGEAIDLALKVARGVTGRQGIVSARGGYHGHTGLALAAGDAQYREPFGPNLPGFTQVAFADLEALEAAVDDDTAAVILEPIPATLGMPIAKDAYFTGAQTICRDHGAKLIVDEVQTGLGRTGRMWCYQHHGLQPDMLVCGKGLSGGIYPISATLMTAECHSFFDDRPFIHISTFGGSEIGCAAARAVLEITTEPGFLEHVNALAGRFERGLRSDRFVLRQRGLMMGLAFPAEGLGMVAAKMCFDGGIFAVYANNDTSVLQFLPPLVTRDGEADEIIELVLKALG